MSYVPILCDLCFLWNENVMYYCNIKGALFLFNKYFVECSQYSKPSCLK